jgi:phosphoribosylanthranilate isomerase
MFRIKICGITTAEDARLARDAGADAIGLNFYAKSRRYVDPSLAQTIAREVSGDVTIVGLFVNSSAEEIATVSSAVSLDVIQLHGDEPPELLVELGSARILRAFRYGSAGMRPIAEYLERCGKLGCMPKGLLIDAHAAGKYGGTGKRVDWQRLAGKRMALPDVPLILAGGLRPENVAEAIHIVQPDGVDVSSGVELQEAVGESPRKSASQVRAFVAAASDAL